MRTLHRMNRGFTPTCYCNVAAEVIGAGITAGASLIGAGASAIGQANLNKKNREWSEQQAEKQREWNEMMYNKQNEWNLDFWNKENEYNLPENQMQRLRDAGLNPLYYGLDGNSAGHAMEAAQPLGYEQASLQNMPNPYGNLNNAMMQAAQVYSLQLENKLKEKELGIADQKNSLMLAIMSGNVESLQQSIKESISRVNNNEMDTALKEMQIEREEGLIALDAAQLVSIGLDNKLKEELNPLLIQEQTLQNQLLSARTAHEEERILAEIADIRAGIAVKYAQAALLGSEKGLVDEQKEGQRLKNVVLSADTKYADANAANRSKILKATAGDALINYDRNQKLQGKKQKAEEYYLDHYEQAFTKYWSQSGRDWGITSAAAQGIGSAAMLGFALAAM